MELAVDFRNKTRNKTVEEEGGGKADDAVGKTSKVSKIIVH